MSLSLIKYGNIVLTIHSFIGLVLVLAFLIHNKHLKIVRMLTKKFWFTLSPIEFV